MSENDTLTSTFSYVQVDQFQPNADGWNIIGNVSWQQLDAQNFILTNEAGFQVKVSFLSPSAFRVRFKPVTHPDYSNNNSYAVINRNLAPVTVNVNVLSQNGGTLLLDTGILQVYIGLQPYGIAVYKNGQLITEDTYEKNIVYSDEAVANLMVSPSNESYFAFGEKAGSQLDKKEFSLTFFNYDNFTYNDIGADGNLMVPSDNQGGPLNPSGPLYNSMPFMLAVGKGNNTNPAVQYSYGIFLDNVSQTYFNLGSNDYSDMNGKYYFGALYGELDYYVMVGTENASSKNVIADVINQYTQLTGKASMPPMYALGYQQGCYGYYSKDILLNIAQAYRNANIPIDGLHIDVDFQNNYRTFTSSDLKFPDPKGMFDTLHAMGFKCSTNITGIISANPLDENGNTNTPYPALDSVLNLNQQDAADSTYRADAPVQPFIYNTRYQEGESPEIFLANENYGTDNNNFNPFEYPSPMFPHGTNQLGTYGFYSDLGHPDIQAWWGEQYDYLLRIGLDMIWQDMTCPAVVPNPDNNNPDKTLPLDLMMYDKVTESYQPNAKIHNAFPLNLIQATYNGIAKLKSSDAYQGLYNYKKRNFIIARGGASGVHKYAGIWTGDSASSWDFLSINIPEVLNIGLSGLPISGCDIGGFATGSGSESNGVTNYELFTRWMTCGAFLPWYRNHYDGYTKAFQEPFNYGEPVPSNCRKYIEIRYKLLQVFYDAMYENTQSGMPIARAMFLNEINDPNVFSHLDDQFFVGQDILVAPIVNQSWYRSVYLPSGSNWYVFDDEEGSLEAATPGGSSYEWYVPLNLVPIYIREGAIIPMRQLEQYVGQLPQNYLTFTIYPGKDSSYQLYQDDHISADFTIAQDNTATQVISNYRLTHIESKTIEGHKQLVFTRIHDAFTPKETFYYICYLGYTSVPASITSQGFVISALESESELENSTLNAYYYDSVNQKVLIKIFDLNQQQEVMVY